MPNHLIEYAETGRAKDRETWAERQGALRDARESALGLREEEREKNPRFAVWVDSRRIKMTPKTAEDHWREISGRHETEQIDREMNPYYVGDDGWIYMHARADVGSGDTKITDPDDPERAPHIARLLNNAFRWGITRLTSDLLTFTCNYQDNVRSGGRS